MLYHPSMKTFDLFLNKSIKVLLVVNFIIMLIIGSFFVQPVYADDSIFRVLPSGQFTSYTSDMPWISPYGNFNIGYNTVNSQPVYCFIAPASSTDTIYFLSLDPVAPNSRDSYYIRGVQNNGNYYSYPSFDQTLDNGYNLARGQSLSSGGSYDSSIIRFDSVEDAIVAFDEFLNPPERVSFDGLRIPAGYFARIELWESGASFNVNTKMPVVSGNSAVDPWPDSSQVFLPSVYQSPSDIDVSSMSSISWLKSGTLSTLGQTYSARAVLSGNLRYVWIYNPIQMKPTFVSDTVYYAPNGPIILTNTNDIRSVRLYAATAYLTSNVVSSNDDEYYDAVVTEGGISWTNENGVTSVPPDGGGNTPAGDPKSLVDQFKDILSDLVGRIEELLIAPVSYIQRIISAGDTFFAWLSGLWSWLPSPVSGIITSVLYVMAVVGALKLLWR